MKSNEFLTQLSQLSFTGQQELIDSAASLMAASVKKDRLIHIAGCDMHTGPLCASFFFCEGTLACINLITDPTFSTMHSTSRAFYLQDAPMVGRFLIEYYRNITEGDTVILFDLSATGPSAGEMTQAAKEKGAKVVYIGVKDVPGADLNILTGHTAQLNGFYMLGLLWTLNLSAIEKLEAEGISPDIWASLKEDGNTHNEKLITKYINRIKHI